MVVWGRAICKNTLEQIKCRGLEKEKQTKNNPARGIRFTEEKLEFSRDIYIVHIAKGEDIYLNLKHKQRNWNGVFRPLKVASTTLCW